MMSYQDRRRLAAIERQLQLEDPAFAKLFTAPHGRRRRWRRAACRAAAAVVGTLCVLAAIAGLLADSVVLFVSATTMAVAAGWAYHRVRRAPG